MQSIEIGGRKIPLLYDMGAMEQGYAEFGSMEAFQAALNHKEGRNMVGDLIRLLVVLGNNGLDAEGATADLDARWVRHHMEMRKTRDYSRAVNMAVAEGVRREIRDEPKPGEAVDGYLEDEKKA